MQRNKVESWKPTCGIQFMLNPRTLGIVCVGMYLLAMCLPAIAAKSYYKTYLLHGWEVTYMCAVLSFAPSMNLGERASFIVGPFAESSGCMVLERGIFFTCQERIG